MIVFHGSTIFHERIRPRGTAVLYIKINDENSRSPGRGHLQLREAGGSWSAAGFRIIIKCRKTLLSLGRGVHNGKHHGGSPRRLHHQCFGKQENRGNWEFFNGLLKDKDKVKDS